MDWYKSLVRVALTIFVSLHILGKMQSQGILYDDISRLVRHESDFGIIEYTYDKVGNRLQYEILANQGLSDLHPSNLILSSGTSSPGSTITLSFTLKNLGEGAAGLHQQKIYLSTTPSVTGAIELLAFYVSAVTGLDSVTLTENITLPGNSALGTYYILVNTDDAEQVEESAEDNNLAFLQIELLNCPPMTITFPEVINEACGNGEGSITAEAIGGVAPYAFEWNTVPPQTEATAIHLTAGTYTVTVTDDMGCMASASESIINEGEPPTAGFSFNVDDLTVSFTSTSIGADTFLWNFGDGQTSTVENPIHVYDIPGAFYPCLEVSNSCGDNAYCQLVEPESDGCFPPINLSNGTLGVTSATLEWWEVVFTDHYEVRYRPVGFSEWIIVPTPNDLNWFVIYGLGANTEYEWQVRTFCDDGGVSPWSESHFFMTFPVSSENADEFIIVVDDTITTIEYRTVGSTNDGGYLAAGPQGNNLIVDRYSQSGQHLWRQQLNNGGQVTDIIELVNGDIVVVGERDGDAMVVKLNGTGNYVWTRLLGGAEDDQVSAVKQDADGNLVIAAWTESYGAGGFEAWLFKMDLNGTHLWSRFFGDSEYTLGGDVEISNDGNYVMVMRQRIIVSGTNRRGFGLIKVSPTGSVIWTKSYIPEPGADTYYLDNISEDSQGNFYVAGNGYAKLSSSGTLLWVKKIDNIKQVAIDSLDNIFLIGDAINNSFNADVINIVRINSSGDILETKVIHTEVSYNDVNVWDVVTIGDHLIIGGSTRGFSPGNELDKGLIVIKKSDLLDDCYMTSDTYSNESLSLETGSLSLSSSVLPGLQMPTDTWYSQTAITLYPCGSPCGIMAQMSVPQDTFCSNSVVTFYNVSDGADSYEWSIDSFTNVVDTSVHLSYHFLTSGVYTINLVAFNNLGCNDTVQITMTVLDNPFISLSTNNASCGEMNGMAEVIVTLGISPISYLWSTGDTSSQVTDLVSGVYAVSVYDAYGCISSETFEILDSTAGCELPDLILSDVLITPENSISVDILNQGNGIAVFDNIIFLDAYISSDTILDEQEDIDAGVWILDGLLSILEPDSVFTWVWGDISETDICEYPYLIVKVDRNDGIEELDESNNTSVIYIDPNNICGCTDPMAHNFDQDATQDDGTCETCTDGIQNGDETDVDCGGLFCPECPACNVVTNTNDSAPGSLREAINCVNSNPDLDTITFNIPGSGPYIIQLQSQLPAITNANTVIDGSTQPGFYPGIIEIKSTTQNNGYGLTISNNGIEVYGLQFTGFATGIRMDRSVLPVRTVYVGKPGKGNIFYKNAQGIGMFGLYARTIAVSNEFYGDFSLNFTGIHLQSNDNVVGGSEVGTGNSIHDLWKGVTYAHFASVNNLLQRNSFWCNTIPVSLGTGNITATPNISSATDNEINGTAVAGAVVEVFYSDTAIICTSKPCQGQSFISSAVANGSGDWVLNGTFIPGWKVTANAKAGTTHTSFFAGCVTVEDPGYGCTDSTAHNFDPLAVMDDGSCETCMDSILNGDEINIDCGGALCEPCQFPVCHSDSLTIDESEFNNGIYLYPTVLAIDSSYEFTIAVRRFQSCINFDWTTNGACLDQIPNGNITSNDFGTTFKPCLPISLCDTAIHFEIRITDALGNSTYCNDTVYVNIYQPIYGCMDPMAHNYNPEAGIDDGSCENCADGIQNGDETGIDCGGVICTPCNECNLPDWDAIIALFNATNGPDWFTPWDTTNCNYCDWSGIACNPENRITEIILNSVFGLSGHLPEEIGELDSLQVLLISLSELGDTIPASIGNLSNLVHLELIENQLSGSIPASIGNLSSLWELRLDQNNLTGPLPPELSNIMNPNLATLRLDANNLSGCFPASYDTFCVPQLYYKEFYDNPGLPGGGDFTAFCLNGSGICDTPLYQIIYTSPGLYGITNAVVYNGEVHFVAGLDPTGNFPGYPDPNSKFVKLFLITESDTAYQYESSPSASYPYDGNLKRTSDGKLAFSYQAPTGIGYGFKMPYKVVDTSGLLLNELVFNNQNWGAWGRMFFDSIGEPNIVSFAHSGYILKEHKRDSGAWLSTNISGSGTYMAHPSHAMYDDVKYILLRYGTNNHSLRLYYTNNAGVWLNETIKSNISNSCDIEVSKDGQIHVLFEDDGFLQLGVENGSTWEFDPIAQVSDVYHNAVLYFDCLNNLYVAYQEPDSITVLRKEGTQWQEVYEHTNISSPEGSFQPSIVSKGEELLVIYNDTSNVYQAFIGPEYCCSMVNIETDEYVPGTLRYAVDCAESGDTIVFAPELTGDTIILSNGYLTLGKELSLIVPDSITLFLKAEMDGFMIHITPSGNVVIDRLNLLHTGDIMSESIYNEGILVMKNLDILTSNTSPQIQAIIENLGSIIIQGQVRVFTD